MCIIRTFKTNKTMNRSTAESYIKIKEANKVIASMYKGTDECNAHTQSLAARCLERGIGTSIDLKGAALMYEKASKAGHVLSMHNLGVLLWTGIGVQEQDRRRAVKLFKACAEAGLAAACHKLGVAYEQGCDTLKPDINEALDWYRKAAKKGCAWSKFHLAMCHIEGRGVAVNNEAGIMLLRESAKLGLAIARETLQSMTVMTFGTPRRLLPELKALETLETLQDDGPAPLAAGKKRSVETLLENRDEDDRPHKRAAHHKLDALAKAAAFMKKMDDLCKCEHVLH